MTKKTIAAVTRSAPIRLCAKWSATKMFGIRRQQFAGGASMRKCRDHQSRTEMPDGRAGDQLEEDRQACDPTCTDDAARHRHGMKIDGAPGKKHGEGDKEREFEMRETGMCQTEEEGGTWISTALYRYSQSSENRLRQTRGMQQTPASERRRSDDSRNSFSKKE